MEKDQEQEKGKATTKGYRVLDKNQRGPKGRVHEIIVKMYKDGREPETTSYELFSHGDGCPMPMEHAMKFLSDPAFIVLHPNGHRIMPVEKQDLTKPIQVLREDQVVVTYAELSREALLRRVKVMPGSEDIKENAKHEELVAFMIEWRRAQAKLTDGEQALAEKMVEAGFEGMPSKMLDSMFGERKAA